ncbi:MAG: VOC family protein [Pseudomonadota bacterium]
MQLATVTIVVPDYDEAIAHYCGALGFSLVEDTPLSATKRWVVVAPGEGGAHILLAKADGASQRARVGDQTGGRVAFFLTTDDFAATHQKFSEAGIAFLEAAREEPYGRVAKFRDAFGNLWDLIEPSR